MSELRAMVEESVVRLFDDQVDREFLTDAEDAGFAKDLWNTVLELGIDRVLVNEDNGGMQGTWRDAYSVVRASGEYAVPLPIPEAIVAHWLMEQAALPLREGIPGVLPQTLDAAAGLNEITAEVTRVPWGSEADYFIGLQSNNGHTDVIVIEQGSEINRDANLGRDSRDSVIFNHSPVSARGATRLCANALRSLMALMRSAQIAGAGSACLKLGLEYTSEREQFGRPLARFQAIQHHLAYMSGELATVEAMAASAFESLDKYGLEEGNANNALFEIAAAKCRASDAVEPLTKIGHQVHGAIGFTYEYGLHFLTRRLWSWRAEFGASAEWARYLGATAIAAGGDEIWGIITR